MVTWKAQSYWAMYGIKSIKASYFYLLFLKIQSFGKQIIQNGLLLGCWFPSLINVMHSDKKKPYFPEPGMSLKCFGQTDSPNFEEANLYFHAIHLYQLQRDILMSQCGSLKCSLDCTHVPHLRSQTMLVRSGRGRRRSATKRSEIKVQRLNWQ